MLYLDKTTTESSLVIKRIAKEGIVLDKLERQNQGDYREIMNDAKYYYPKYPGTTIKVSDEINGQWVINVWTENMDEEEIETMYRMLVKDIRAPIWSIIWSPRRHILYPTSFRNRVFTLLLINQRWDFIFPLEIIFMIIEYMIEIPYMITKVSTRYIYTGDIGFQTKKQLSRSRISCIRDYLMVTSKGFYQDLVSQNRIEQILGTTLTYETLSNKFDGLFLDLDPIQPL